MARILVIASFTPSLILFRGDMMREMVAAGHKVITCSPNSDAATMKQLQQWGISHHVYRLQRTGMNPLADWRTYRDLCALTRKIAPDLTLAYTIKPVIYGCLAAHQTGVPHISAMITGLGTAFEKRGFSGGLLTSVARFLYRKALSKATTVFFQNPDDRDVFTDLNLVSSEKTVLINGSGINTERFSPQPVPAGPVVFLLIARLLKEKGVREFATAAQILRQKGYDFRCQIAGFFDHHPQAIARAEMDQWVAAGYLTFLGQLQDVRPVLTECTVYCLPSYREGLPRTVLEAMSTGRAIITTDAPGCRETVQDGKNGYLVAVRDAESLAEAMEAYLKDSNLAAQHGAVSRQLAVQQFDVKVVNRTILKALKLN